MNGPPRDPTECYAYAAMCCGAFGIPPLHRYDWLARIDPMNIRLARESDRIVGGLALVPMGMWIRGARIPTSAMHLVVVPPAERKRGVGRGLVTSALRELHAAGTALCVLYPATEALYRHAGFHDAGVCVRYRVVASDVPSLDDGDDGDGVVERVGRASIAALHDAYRERARHTNGNLDRNPWAWTRVLDPGGATVVHLISPDGRVLAYAVAQRAGEDLHLRDLVALTPKAEQRVLSHLASSGVRFIEWNGPPISPSLPFSVERVRERVWFARVCNIESAFASLRAAPDTTASLELDVRDDLISDNAGRWIVTISDGAVSIRRGGDGRRPIDIADLAALVTGHTESALGGPRPWMSDLF